jgi:hypothetical protein
VAADPRRATLNPDGAMFLLPDGRSVSPDYLTRRFARLVNTMIFRRSGCMTCDMRRRA